jgi:hypothetical protein
MDFVGPKSSRKRIARSEVRESAHIAHLVEDFIGRLRARRAELATRSSAPRAAMTRRRALSCGRSSISIRRPSWGGGFILMQFFIVRPNRVVQTKDDISDNIVIVGNLNTLSSVQSRCLLFLERLCPRLFKIERRVIDKQPFLKFRCQRVHGSEQILSGDAVRMARRRAKKRVQLSEGTNPCKSFNVWPLSITHQLPLIPVGVLCILERVPTGGKCANLAFDFMLARLAFAPAIIVDLLSNDASGDPSGKQRAAAANEPSGKILVSCHRAAEPFWKLRTRNIHETPGNFGVIGGPSVSKSQSANDNCRQSACESEACEDAVPIHARHATDNGRQPVDNGRQSDCNDDCKPRSKKRWVSSSELAPMKL